LLIMATIVGNALGWAYQIAVARILGVELFGVFGALVGIFYVAMLGGGAFRVEIAAITARVAARRGEDAAIGNFLRICRQFMLIFVPVLLIFLFASVPIASFLHVNSIGPVIVTGFTIFGTLLFMVALGFLQGLQRFRSLGVIGYIMPPALKLTSGLAFIMAGLGLVGAMLAVLVAEFSGLFASLWLWRKRLIRAPQAQSGSDGSVYRLILPGLVLALFLATPTNLDVPLVVHFFGPQAGGIFASAATLGKIITFLPMGVSLAVLPMVAEQHARRQPTTRLALQGLAATILLSGMVAFAYCFLPDFFINLFFGQSYLKMAAILGWYGATMVVFSANTLLVQYAVAMNRRFYVFISGLVTLAVILTVAFWHTSLQQVIFVMLAGNLLLFLVCLPLLLPVRRSAEDTTGK
jgi:O-antigen/teichoic acid export membrane protein